jgi:hypothetical protein
MKNLVKIPSQKILRVFETLRIYTILLPLVVSLGACSLAEALKPTPQIDEYGLDKNAPFACLVNGKKWVPSGKNPLFVANPIAVYVTQTRTLGVGGDNITSSSFEKVSMRVEQFTGIRKYYIDNKNVFLAYYDQDKYPSGQTSKIPKAFTGYLNITKFDTIKYQTSGTFEFKTLDYKGDTIHITQGRFNLNF